LQKERNEEFGDLDAHDKEDLFRSLEEGGLGNGE
jgi:hypothetical protein